MAEKDFRVQKGIVVADGDVTLATDHTVKAGTLQTLTADYIQITGNDIKSVGSSSDVDIDFILQNQGKVVLPKVEIADGTIDGVTIATSDITVGSGKTLDVSAGTLTLADDQISGDKISGGTIGTITITELAGDVETKDILMSNGGARDITVEARTGTNDTGRSLTINAGLGDGTGTGGSIVLKGGGGTTGNGGGATSHATGLTVHPGGQVEIDNANIDGGNIDGTVIGATTQAAASVDTLLATSHARVNGTARESLTLLQVNGGAKGGGATGSSLTYSEARLHSDIANDDLAGTWNSYLGMSAAFILDNAENATGIGQGVIFTEGRTATSGNGTSWAIGRQRIGSNIATANTKFTIGFVEKSYEDVGYANSSNDGVDADSPMAAAQSLIEINTYGDLQLMKGRGGASEGQLVFSGEASDGTDHTIKLKAPHNTMTANQSYTLPVAPAASSGYVLSATTAGVMSWVAQSGGISISGTDHRMVRMSGTTGIQDTGVTVDDNDNITGVNRLTIDDDLFMSDASKIKPLDRSGDDLAGYDLNIYAGQGTGSGASGKVQIYSKSSDGGSASGNHSMTNTVRITDNKVGIGTNPTYKLDVSGAIRTSTDLHVGDDIILNSNNAVINPALNNGSNQDGHQLFIKGGQGTGSGASGDIVFHTKTANGGSATGVHTMGAAMTLSDGDVTVHGNLTVSGDTITANVGTLDVEDKNITLNKSSSDSSSTADGAGITIQDAVDASNDASFTWNATNDDWQLSHTLDVTGSITATGDITAGSGQSFIIGSASMNETDLEKLDGITNGTAAANKALVVDGSKNIGTLGTITASTLSVDAVAIVDTSTEDGASIANAASNGVKELANFAVATYRTVKYVGHIHDDTTHHTDAFEVLVTYNGNTAPADVDACYLTTYAYMNTGTNPLGSLSVTLHDGSGGTGTSHIGLQFANATTSTAFSYSVVGTHIKRQ